MRIGLISDLHLGYSHGTKTNKDGVNIREQDVLDAAIRAVDTLVENGVDVIVDGGDLAHVPSPKKRALVTLFSMMERIHPVKFYSANGNHTLVRTSSDIHLYDVLADRCDNFRGYTKPTYVEEIGGYFVPYSISSEEIKEWLGNTPQEAQFVVGHWACDDVPWPGEHIPAGILPDIPVFLGHFHTRKIGKPNYIGSTERFAWGEHSNPTGVEIYDSESKNLESIELPSRLWTDLKRDCSNYLDVPTARDSIVRVNITCTQAEYHTLDMVKLRKKLDKTLEFTIRRVEPILESEEEPITIISSSLEDSWKEHISRRRMPTGISRKEVEDEGLSAITRAG